MLYKLDHKNRVVPVENEAEANSLLRDIDSRRIARDEITCGEPPIKITISTVFMVMDHNPHKKGKPTVFETAIFYKGACRISHHYKSFAAAVKGHSEWIEWAKENWDYFV